MKAVTFNIRCDIQPKSEAEFREMLASLPDGVKAPAVRFPKGDGVNAWEYRKALDVRAIRRASPEVVGFQEILPHMGLYPRRELPVVPVRPAQAGAAPAHSPGFQRP